MQPLRALRPEHVVRLYGLAPASTSGRNRPKLLKHSHHVQVMMDLADLVALERVPNRRWHHDPLTGRRHCPGRAQQLTSVRPLPYDFLHHDVATADRLANRPCHVGKSLLPPLGELHIHVRTLGAPASSRLFVRHIRAEWGFESLPVASVKCLDKGVRHLHQVCGLC
jgi:hypothetical protein